MYGLLIKIEIFAHLSAENGRQRRRPWGDSISPKDEK